MSFDLFELKISEPDFHRAVELAINQCTKEIDELFADLQSAVEDPIASEDRIARNVRRLLAVNSEREYLQRLEGEFRPT